jgi:hypothetical protein
VPLGSAGRSAGVSVAGRCSPPRSRLVLGSLTDSASSCPGDDDHRGCWCVTNCVTITAYGSGLPWILRDASAGQYGRSPLVRALWLLLRDEEAVGSNPATPTPKRQVKAVRDRVAIASGDELRDYRILSGGASLPLRSSAVPGGDHLPVAASGTETRSALNKSGWGLWPGRTSTGPWGVTRSWGWTRGPLLLLVVNVLVRGGASDRW